jgi:hypothetical protein
MPEVGGRMKLIALVTEPKSIVLYLTTLSEPIDVPTRSTSRGPPYWKSTFLRRKAKPARDSKRLNPEPARARAPHASPTLALCPPKQARVRVSAPASSRCNGAAPNQSARSPLYYPRSRF